MKTVILPIHVGITKPFTVSHLYHLIYLDTLFRVLGLKEKEVILGYHRLEHDLTEQVIKLSLFLRRKYPQVSKEFWLQKDEVFVGREYIEANRHSDFYSEEEILNLQRAIEEGRVEHEFYSAILPHWQKQHLYLGLKDPGFFKKGGWRITNQELVKLLSQAGFIFNTSVFGGDLYLDLTDKGLPLKIFARSDLSPKNYMMNLLKTSFDLTREGDKIIFVYDAEMDSDFVILAEVLKFFGREVKRVAHQRVKVNGLAVSARHGGWEGFTLRDILQRYSPLYKRTQLVLGLKLYFLRELSAGNGKPPREFSYQRLDDYLIKAGRILAEIDSCREQVDFEEDGDKIFSSSPKALAALLMFRGTKPEIKNFIIEKIFCNFEDETTRASVLS